MFNLVDDKSKLPTRGTAKSACIDLYARKDISISVGETKIVPLGLTIDYEKVKDATKVFWFSVDNSDAVNDLKYEDWLKSHFMQLFMRSSGATKKGLIIANGTGVIDFDYKHEIGVVLHNPVNENTITWWIDRIANICGFKTSYCNDNKANTLIKAGDGIAQITIMEHQGYLFDIESDEERIGGYGSTDT